MAGVTRVLDALLDASSRLPRLGKNPVVLIAVLLGGSTWAALAAGLPAARPQPASLLSDTTVVFGPMQFNASNPWAIYIEQFTESLDDQASYELFVENGERAGVDQVSSGKVFLNGVQVLEEDDFASAPVVLLRGVSLADGTNTLEVHVKGQSSKYVKATIRRITADPGGIYSRRFQKSVAADETFADSFALPAGMGPPYALQVHVGDGPYEPNQAVILLNGDTVGRTDEPCFGCAGVQDIPLPVDSVDLLPFNELEVTLVGIVGASVRTTFFATDTLGPAIDLTSPTENQVTALSQLDVAGTVTDLSPPITVTVNGDTIPVDGAGAFTGTVALPQDGEHVVVVTAEDSPEPFPGQMTFDTVGNITEVSRTVIRDTEAPSLSITAPVDGFVTGATTVPVSGSAQDLTPIEATADGIPLLVDGPTEYTGSVETSTFSGEVPLSVEGANYVTVAVTDAAGNSASGVRLVTRDTEAPVITVTSPTDGAEIEAETVLVTGTVSDLTAVTLTVNDAATPVIAGEFSLEVPLSTGPNTIVVAATDAAGNGAVSTVSVTRIEDSDLPPDPATVAPPLNPTVATSMASSVSFLWEGPNPVQTGVSPGAIKPVRVGVLRGHVLDAAGAPLPGVGVSILDHPELGGTLSRADGAFDLAVNGGGPVTLQFQMAGYLPGQRTVDIPWQEFRTVPDVRLVELDTVVTVVDLAGASEVQVVRGSVVQDGDGPRQATVLFDPGTDAYLEMADGTTQPIGTLSVRATEYTVGAGGPEAMPGELPPTTHYTYAVELSADEALAAGAAHVRFSQPVDFYVENFLEFPVGLPVPVGWYDRNQARWVPEPNGRIIEVLSVDSGMAILDTNGDAEPDFEWQLQALGIDDAERTALANTYAPGVSLWRAQLTHFTSVDLNYSAAPDGDGEPPPPDEDGDGDGINEQDEEPVNDCKPGSVILCQSQILREEIPVSGTPFTLNYGSDRVPGRLTARTLEIGLTGPQISPNLTAIEVQINVAGRQFQEQFVPAPDLSYSFAWDGLDAYGRPVQGQQPAQVRIGYAYPLVYRIPANIASSFGLGCDGTLSPYNDCVIPVSGQDSARQTGAVWRESEVTIGPWDARGQGLAGWTLSVHHTYTPPARELQLGTGDRRNARSMSAAMTTYAGTGEAGYAGDGGHVSQALVRRPHDVEVAADGSIYIADTDNHRVRRVAPDGTITTIAGTGVAGCSGDGGPALQATLNGPTEVLPTPDGGFYITDHFNHRVRRIDPDGTIRTAAGFEQCGVPDEGTQGTGPLGDGGSATRADLFGPDGLALGQDGSLYIADRGNDRVRRVGPDGIIQTVVGGGGNFLGSVQGLPGTTFHIPRPDGLSMAPDGNLYLAVHNHDIVARLDPSGLLFRVAGTGSEGFTGDGGPAAQAALDGPEGVTVGPDGFIYITDARNNRIRRIGPDGIINTFAGTGSPAYGGDGGAPIRSSMTYPMRITVAPNGDMYIADVNNSRIRRILPPVPGFDDDDILIPSAGGGERYHFDPAGRHLRTLHGTTGAVLYEFVYDSVGRLTAVTDADGLTTTIERDTEGRPAAIVAPFGQRTELAIDSAGFLQSVVSPAGDSTGFSYDENGLLLSTTTPRGHVTLYDYDDEGRFLRTDDPAGGFQTLDRLHGQGAYTVEHSTALGRTTAYEVERLPTGEQRRVTIDPAGLQTILLFRTGGGITRTSPDGTSTTLSRGGDPRWGMQAPIVDSITTSTPAGLVSQVRTRRNAVLSDPADPFSLVGQTDSVFINGRVFITTYDAAGREYGSTTPEGRMTTARVDSVGRVVEQEAGGLAPVAYAYDAAGRPDSVSQADRTWRFAYDTAGLLLSTTDPLGRSDSLFYDPVGRVTRQVLRDGREIAYGYDAAGNLTSLAPPGRPAHTFGYNAVGLDSVYDPPDVPGLAEDRTFYEYDLDRDLTRIVRPDSLTIDFAYDSAGRVDAITSPRGVVDYAYSAITGQLTGITAPGGEALSFAYDGALPTAETWTGTVAGQVAFAYDDDFRLSGLAVNGDTVAYGYDDDGLLTAAGDLALNRDPLNGLLRSTHLGGVTTRQAHNAFGEVSGDSAWASGVLVFARTYQRDDLGRITSVEDFADGVTTVWAYGYDDAGRLETVTRDGAAYASYAYDSNGNRLSRTSPLGVETGVYDAQDRLLSYAGADYAYTPNGELSIKVEGADTTRYEYDVFGNLVRVELPSDTVIEYVIDGRNRRVGKKVDGVLVQGFLYGDQLNPVAELDGSGNVVSRFTYGAKANVPDYMVRGGETFRIVSDHLGSVRMVVNVSTGAVAQRLAYDAWGRVLEDTNPGWQPFGFGGGLWSAAVPLYRFGARDYDSETGRWSLRDAVGFRALSGNLYRYANLNPVNVLDPTGFFALPTCTTEFLQPYFPGLDMSKVQFHNALPRTVQFARWLGLTVNMGAITIGNNVYFDGGYSPYTTGGISSIAHELVHVTQWNFGWAGFIERYLGSYFGNRRSGMDQYEAYRNILHEKTARRLQERVLLDLLRLGNPCEDAICEL